MKQAALHKTSISASSRLLTCKQDIRNVDSLMHGNGHFAFLTQNTLEIIHSSARCCWLFTENAYDSLGHFWLKLPTIAE